MVAWMHDMPGHAQKKSVERTCESAHKTDDQLHEVSTQCLSEHRINPKRLGLGWRIIRTFSQTCTYMLVSCSHWSPRFIVGGELSCTTSPQMEGMRQETRETDMLHASCGRLQTVLSGWFQGPVIEIWDSKIRTSHESWQTRSPRQEAYCARLEAIHVFRVPIYWTPKWVSLTNDTFIQRCGVVTMVVRGDDFVIGGDLNSTSMFVIMLTSGIQHKNRTM